MDLLLRPQALVVIENSSPAHPSAPSERETWKHIAVALAPMIARLHRKRVSDASEVQP